MVGTNASSLSSSEDLATTDDKECVLPPSPVWIVLKLLERGSFATREEKPSPIAIIHPQRKRVITLLSFKPTRMPPLQSCEDTSYASAGKKIAVW